MIIIPRTTLNLFFRTERFFFIGAYFLQQKHDHEWSFMDHQFVCYGYPEIFKYIIIVTYYTFRPVIFNWVCI